MHFIKEVASFFYSGALSPFQSLNKLGPLVADFKILNSGRAGPIQDNFSQFASHSFNI